MGCLFLGRFIIIIIIKGNQKGGKCAIYFVLCFNVLNVFGFVVFDLFIALFALFP